MTRNRTKKKKPAEEEDYFAETKPEPPDPDGWPSRVPILTAEDMAWEYETADGRRDLSSWLQDTFDTELGSEPKAHREAYKTLCEVLTERFGKTVKTMWTFSEFITKHQYPSAAWQAACWNEMLSRLGYTVPEGATEDPGRDA